MPSSTPLVTSLLAVLPLIFLWVSPDARALALMPQPADNLAVDGRNNSTLNYLQLTLGGLLNAMDFFEREHQQCNLDAVIGTRMVQATFTVLIRNLDKSGEALQVPSNILEKIKRVRKMARKVSENSTPYVVASEPDYFKKIGPIIQDGLFELNYPSRYLPNDVIIWAKRQKEVMREEESDTCLAEIFRTVFGYSCSISSDCWDLMTSPGYSKYSLSHQIFYLEIAQQLNCADEMARHLAVDDQTLDSLQDTFCANMLAESRDIAQAGFPARSQDLFMEQAALCGMLGYHEFFSPDWMSQVLSWQDKDNGCYRWAAWPMKEHQPHEATRLLRMVLSQIRPDPIRPHRRIMAPHHRRGKREEKRVRNGCLCHRTTVAAGALAQYTRFLLEDWLEARTGTRPTPPSRQVRTTRTADGSTSLEIQAGSSSLYRVEPASGVSRTSSEETQSTLVPSGSLPEQTNSTLQKIRHSI